MLAWSSWRPAALKGSNLRSFSLTSFSVTFKKKKTSVSIIKWYDFVFWVIFQIQQREIYWMLVPCTSVLTNTSFSFANQQVKLLWLILFPTQFNKQRKKKKEKKTICITLSSDNCKFLVSSYFAFNSYMQWVHHHLC